MLQKDSMIFSTPSSTRLLIGRPSLLSFFKQAPMIRSLSDRGLLSIACQS